MLTALFPPKGRPITIKQGQTGDCYLLSSLNCMFHSGPGGLAQIQSLFTETEDGVTVRIKRTVKLQEENISNDKYDYRHDKNTDEDVFTM